MLAMFAAVVLIGALVYLLWGSEGYGSRRFSYQVVVNVDGKELAGASVWEQTTEQPWGPQSISMRRSAARGEAIAIPVSSTQAVLVLKRHQSPGGYAGYGALLDNCGVYSPREVREYRGGCDLPLGIPFVVLVSGDLHGKVLPRFELVRQTAGARVSLVSARIEATDAPITIGLADTYPWIATLPATAMDLPAKGHAKTGAGLLFGVDFVSH